MQSLIVFHFSGEYLTLALKLLVEHYVRFMAWMLPGKCIIGKMFLLLHFPKSPWLASRNFSFRSWSCTKSIKNYLWPYLHYLFILLLLKGLYCILSFLELLPLKTRQYIIKTHTNIQNTVWIYTILDQYFQSYAYRFRNRSYSFSHWRSMHCA